MLPHILSSFYRLLEGKGFSYTYLSKEYCCGNLLYRPPVKAHDDRAMAEYRELSKEFVSNNIRQAKKLGAKRLLIFCSSCYPIYKHVFPEENIVFYPVAMNKH
jgi:Fe-S oxidoreductase